MAAPKLLIQPIQTAEESIRYNHGVPTVDQVSVGGSVQVRPAPIDHGSLAFNVAVFNDGKQSANLDVTSFTLTSNGVTVAAMTVDTLEKKAKSRAMWTQIGLAAVGGLGAAAAASQRDTYRSTLYTPRGAYHHVYSAPSVAGQIQATAIAAGTGIGIATIQSRLDQKLEELGEDVIQMTTVSPGESYAGMIVFEKVKLTALPAQVTMTVNWNGIAYPFTFQVAKPGTPAPLFKPIEAAAIPTAEIGAAQIVPTVDVAAPAAPPVVPAAATANVLEKSRTPSLMNSSLLQ
ncbi:hypothetical protein [Novosphingobium sp. 18050]|nr:hypothetical protein [Novosphingobium sp. 18050]